VQALEARVSELEDGGAVESPLAKMANDLLGRTEQLGGEFQRYALAEAEAERGKLAQTGEAQESARAHAEEIVAQAERKRDELSRLAEESHGQIAQFIEEGRVTAEERARSVWEGVQDRLGEPVLELGRIHEQRREVLEEVAELQELIDTSWRRVIRE
jgi:ClpP class serine protease